jgi:acyl-CoA synthetase (AMP-forming)/AMP-acid ligase II
LTPGFGPRPASYRPLTLSSGLRAAAARDPSKTAMIQGETRRSYALTLANVNRIANLCREELGLRAGDRAAVISPNAMAYIELVVGISDVGAAAVTPNPKLSPREVADICEDAGVRVVFVHPECADRVDPALLPGVERIVVIGPELDALMARASDVFTPGGIAEWDVFSIPYTSGTTGKPKGVMLPHRSRTLAFLTYATEYGCYSPDDHFLALSPMCHGAGFAFAYCAIFLGGTVEITTRFDPEAVLRTLHKGEVTGLFTVPTHYHGIFSLEDRLLASLRGNRLNGIVANAAPLAQDTTERIVDYFGPGLLHETYGSTEGGVVTNLRPKDQLRKVRCVGQPFVGNHVKLLDPDGLEVTDGAVGELFSTSPCMFNGYWKKPEQTAEAFRDGWVSVGDMARRDEDGFYYIVDRKKDVVISGGINIYPREVETVLDAHPAIAETAVIGVPDARWGEQLVAYVVFKGGARPDEAELTAHARARLADYKLPKAYRAVDALPRNANGKVLKTELRQRHADALIPEGSR